MIKKDIITDFGELKGKVFFSEEPRATAPKTSKTSKATKESQATEPHEPHSETIIKVGHNVVLMDSNLRGKIISLGGKSAVIELEDGMTIQIAYGEFAVTNETEVSVLKHIRPKPSKSSASTKQSSVPAPCGTLTIDLHIESIPGGRNVPKGRQLQFQMAIFRRTVRENLCHRGMKICFIHGVGDGILKAAIRKELDEVLALRCSYSVGDPAVTIVSIR